MDSSREMLRHAVATVAYRASKALRNAPSDFSGFTVSVGSRTPGQILAHMGDLFDWALCMAKGEWTWRDSEVRAWGEDVERFFAALTAFDDALSADAPLGYPAELLMQGPVADALNHIGQLTYLRRLAGSPVRGESYARAEIRVGQTGMVQPSPRAEFD